MAVMGLLWAILSLLVAVTIVGGLALLVLARMKAEETRLGPWGRRDGPPEEREGGSSR